MLTKYSFVNTYIKIVFGCILFLCLSVLPLPLCTQAASKQINITTKNYNGGKAIQEALNLQSGEKPKYEQLTVYIQGEHTTSPAHYSFTVIREYVQMAIL